MRQTFGCVFKVLKHQATILKVEEGSANLHQHGEEQQAHEQGWQRCFLDTSI